MTTLHWKLSIPCLVALCATVSSQIRAAEVRRFAAPDGANGDQFGKGLAVSGDRMIIGAWADSDQGSASGSAYVYERDASGSWTQVAKLLASDGEELYYFGYSVALEGDLALIGAFRADDPVDSSGAVYVFERSAEGVWLETGKLVTGRPGEDFGSAIALQGNRAVIGASPGHSLPGRVFVYERDLLHQWNQVAMLPNETGGDWYFGYAVALDGDRILVGAYGGGTAYVFERETSGIWILRSQLFASDGFGNSFGYAVALRGDRAVIGAFHSRVLGLDSGEAYVFERTASGEWTERARLIDQEGQYRDRLGAAVALDGRRILVGAPGDDLGPVGGPGQNAGSVLVFEQGADGSWLQIGKLRSSNPVFDDQFGISLSLSGDQLLTGLLNGDGATVNSGSACLFDLQPLSVNVPRGRRR